MTQPRLILHPGKEKSLLRRHPWLFSGAVRQVEGSPQPGDTVDVFSADHRWLAAGHYQDDSIVCKIITFEPTPIDENFWHQRIADAINYRKTLRLLAADGTPVSPHDTMFRLVNAEGDRLPGLIADYYNHLLVLQAHTPAMHRLLPLFSRLLKEQLPDIQAIYDKSQATLPHQTTQNHYIESTIQPPQEWQATESAIQYLINPDEGQKTGFFLDQRDNRRIVANYSSGKRLLNCFGYTGGFTLSALRGGASHVDTVDISSRAINLCNRHVQLNFPNASHNGIVADVTRYLDTIDNQYDIIILDPPAFAKNHRSLQNGLKGYRSINQRAIEHIKPNGLIFTFSCSQAVSNDQFLTTLFTAAANARRNVRIVQHLQPSPDHPVSIYHPEGHYLKGLLLQVE